MLLSDLKTSLGMAAGFQVSDVEYGVAWSG